MNKTVLKNLMAFKLKAAGKILDVVPILSEGSAKKHYQELVGIINEVTGDHINQTSSTKKEGKNLKHIKIQ